MKVITKQFTKEILLATLFVLVALVALFTFFDLVHQLRRIGRVYSLWNGISMTLMEIPTRVYQVMPIAGLLGTVFTMSRWAAQSEFTILRISGLSPTILARMLLVPGLIMVVFTYALGEYIAPQAFKHREGVQAELLNKALSARGYSSGIWTRDVVRNNDGSAVGIRFVNVLNLVAGEESRTGAWRVFEFDENRNMTRLIRANEANFIPGKGWHMHRATVDTIPVIKPGMETTVEKTQRRSNTDLVLNSDLQPSILGVMTVRPEYMSISELAQYITHLKENRQNTDRYDVALWTKVFYPLAILVMMAVGMPFAYLNSRSGGTTVKIFSGLMIGICFYTLNNIFTFMGAQHGWQPVVVALLPSFVMLILAVLAMYLIEKR